MNTGDPEKAKRVPLMVFPGLEDAEDLNTKAQRYETMGKTRWDNVAAAPIEIREELEVPVIAESEEEPEGKPSPEEPPAEPTEPPEEPEEPEEGTPEARAQSILASGFKDRAEFLATVKVTKETKILLESVEELLSKADPINRQIAEEIRDRVTAHLLRLRRPPSTPAAFQKAVLRQIETSYTKLAPELERAGLGDWFEETYRHYKTTDRSVWTGAPGGQPPAIAISFGAKDVRAIKQMEESAHWFFSTFTDNETYRKSMQNFLSKTYAKDGAALFRRNPKVVKAFGKVLGDTTKKLADHEIDRIARTTIARAREQARIMQMNDAGVKTAVVRVHPDACPICQPYEGVEIDVGAEADWIESMAGLQGEEWENEARRHTQEAIRGVPPHEFSDGGGGPLYHPNCRCSVDMKVE
jgi:hypothetical protein